MNLFQGASGVLAALLDDPQHQRLLRLEFPRGDGPEGVLLLANTLEADEGLSRDFNYVVEVLSDSASIALQPLMGKMATVTLVRDDGSVRYFNGYIFELRLLRTDGGFAFYRMVLKPWLAYLRLRHDSKVFQQLTLSELCEKLFSAYLERNYRFLCGAGEAVMTLAVQYQESDHNHLHRRLEAAGRHYWYEHSADGHCLCIGDDSTLAEPLDGDATIEFRHGAGSLEQDGIDTWCPVRTVRSTEATVGSHDFKIPRASWASRASAQGARADSALGVSDYTGAYGFREGDAGAALAQLRIEEIDAQAQDFDGGSNTRALAPGRCFTLDGHFSGESSAAGQFAATAEDRAQREYLVLSVRHDASNNYQDGRGAPSRYRNTFRCLRKSVPWRPGRGFHSTDTRIYGVQTATVVGPENEEIHTDQFGRVRLQFHWDRLGRFDAESSPWVRVQTGWAGANFGHISVPRKGQEVVVQFIGGNPDRPFITGGVYNAANMPPWPLPDCDMQSGLKSAELKGKLASQLRLDDSAGRIGAQLMSDHGDSQLNLGWLSTLPNATDGQPRGEGAELRSNEQLALRAAKGMLLSAWKLIDSEDKQMARAELLAMLAECSELADSLGDYAGAHQAPAVDGAPRQALHEAIEAWENGANTAPSGSGGGQPAIAVTAPAGIGFATPQAIVSYAGANLDSVAQKHLQLTAGARVNVNAGKGIALFAHSDGVTAIAHKGKLLLQSQHDETEVNAATNIKFTASNGKLLGMAKEIVLIAEDGSFIKIGGGITLGTNGTITHHGASFPFKGGSTMQAVLPTFDSGETRLKVAMKYELGTPRESAAPGHDVTIARDDGTLIEARGDDEGRTESFVSDALHQVEIVAGKKDGK